MSISSGVIITNGKKILIGRYHKHPFWDIPKGQINDGENFFEAAIREVYEETGIKLKENDLIELGTFEYLPKKKLYLFIYYTRILPKIEELKFQLDGDPEMDEYQYIEINQIQRYLSYNLNRVIQTLKNVITSFWLYN